jgi:hypothetical protein
LRVDRLTLLVAMSGVWHWDPRPRLHSTTLIAMDMSLNSFVIESIS